MGNFLQDVRHAVRLLAKSPGFTAVAVITLALGIGANTAIFSVVNAVLLRPLPYANDDQLVRAVRTQPSMLATIASYPDYTDWRDRGAFTGAAALVGRAFFFDDPSGIRRISGARVTTEFFPLLGVTPVLGRNFLPEEQTRGDLVAILSHRFWTEHFGQDPQIIGRELRMGAQGQTGFQVFRVIGVLPPDFRDPVSPVSGRELYTPLTATAEQIPARNSHWLHVLARRKPEVSLAQARTIVENLSRRGQSQPGGNPMQLPIFTAVPLRDVQEGDTRRALWLLLGAVGFVLLIACVNVSNLLLARANARRQEMAVRIAVGASRGRLLSQVLTESMLLSGVSGGAAMVLLLWGVEGIKAVSPGNIPRLDDAGLNIPVFAFALLSTALCGVLFGALPAARAARQDVMAAMKNTRASSGRGQRRTFSALLVGEVALTMVLLAGAALALQSLTRLVNVNTGFESSNVLTVSTIYAGQWDAARQRGFFADLSERVRALPGVRAVGVVDNLPLAGSWSQYTTDYRSFLERYPAEKAERRIEYEAGIVAGDYFRVMSIPILIGRGFSPAALGGQGEPEVLVNQALARELWGSESPIGQRVNIGGEKRRWAQVVGVTGNIRHRGLRSAVNPSLYMTFGGKEAWGGTLVVRSDGDSERLGPQIREIVRGLDSGVVIQRIRAMRDIFSEHTASSLFMALLLGSFAALATLLAMIGTYGVLAYAVSQRTREIGIRLALGAEPVGMLRMVIRNGLALVGVGIVIGTGAALWLSRYLTTMLFEVSGTNPLTYVAVASSLMAAALVACYLPARRAAKTDPIVALRYE